MKNKPVVSMKVIRSMIRDATKSAIERAEHFTKCGNQTGYGYEPHSNEVIVYEALRDTTLIYMPLSVKDNILPSTDSAATS